MPTKQAIPYRSGAPRVARKPTRTPLEEDSPKFERRRFELDRNIVIRQVTALRRTIANGARQMEMIAMEKVFDKPLAEEILHQSKAMRQLARGLRTLAVKVASSTGYPKVDER